MRRKLLVLLAVVAVLAVVIAAPVSAKKPVRGDQEMILSVLEGDDVNDPPTWLCGCEDEFMSWFGQALPTAS